MSDDLSVEYAIETREYENHLVRTGQRCSRYCDGKGPDWADRGPNPEDAIPIPCSTCGRKPGRDE